MRERSRISFIGCVAAIFPGLNKEINLLKYGMGMVPLVTWMLTNGYLDIMYVRSKIEYPVEKKVLQIGIYSFGVKGVKT